MDVNRLYNKRTNRRNFSCADYTIINLEGNHMKPDRHELISKMVRARAKLNLALDHVAPQDEVYPSWKLKQLLDHITGWDELVASAFRDYAHGDSPTVKAEHGIDRFNAASVEARRALSLEQSRQAYHDARAAVIQALQEMPDKKLVERFRAPWGGMCTVSSVVKIFVSHELEHAKQIEEALMKSAIKPAMD